VASKSIPVTFRTKSDVCSDFTLFVRKKKLAICVQSRSIASAAALSALGLVDSAAANDKKVVSATLLSFQFFHTWSRSARR
jgi:hypothetical protein